MDEITNQALDMILKNDALHERVVEPLKRKLIPLAMFVMTFNVILFFLVCLIAYKLSKIL